jgi:hypothetical protein
MIAQGRSRTLEEWIRQIPESVINETPWLLYWRGMALLSLCLPNERQNFEKAYACFDLRRDRTGLLAAWAGVVNSFILEFGDFHPLDPWLDKFEQLLAQEPLPEDEVGMRVAVAMLLALIFRCPQYPQMPQWAARAEALIHAAEDIEMRLQLGTFLSFYYAWMGNINGMAALRDMLKPKAAAEQIAPLTVIMWHYLQAIYLWFTVAPETPLPAVHAGLDHAQRAGIHLYDAPLLGFGAYHYLSTGQVTAAAECLDRMQAATNPTRLFDISHYYYLKSYQAMVE